MKQWAISSQALFARQAQRLGVYSVPLSEGKREGFPKGKQDIVCSAEKSAAEVSPRVSSNEAS